MERIQNIIIGLGYVGVFGAIFAESGIFLGAFLPGDSLLFTVGLLASQDYFNIVILIPVAALMAILGDNVGYHFGRVVGSKIFNREDSLLFRKSYVKKTQAFYEKYGRKTIIIARFVPIVRTFAPILAGVGKMEYRTFFLFNVIGGIGWTAGMLGAGFLFGNYIPGIDQYLEWIILGIVLLSVLPIGFEWLRARRVHVTKF